jgi:hypothetical protein
MTCKYCNNSQDFQQATTNLPAIILIKFNKTLTNLYYVYVKRLFSNGRVKGDISVISGRQNRILDS